jgi:hypothetical protein
VVAKVPTKDERELLPEAVAVTRALCAETDSLRARRAWTASVLIIRSKRKRARISGWLLDLSTSRRVPACRAGCWSRTEQ